VVLDDLHWPTRISVRSSKTWVGLRRTARSCFWGWRDREPPCAGSRSRRWRVSMMTRCGS
jgi:hypothetical protein